MTQPAVFNDSSLTRLEKFLAARSADGSSAALTPDASTREFFRVNWENETAIACVYPESFVESEQTYLDATNLFAVAGLPVAEIYAFDGSAGIIVHEDFGDLVLRSVLDAAAPAEREKLINDAITLIAEIQFATYKALELNAIAAKLAFDFAKLSWELDFFTTHYFGTLRGEKLSKTDAPALKKEMDAAAQALAARPRILTHRDFHAANLMIDRENRLRIIDHQDARMGAASYDLVSLLLDRIDAPPSDEWITEKQTYFLNERARLGLPKIDAAEFAAEFRLQTVQRCLKAIGTFSFQTAARGKTGYTQFIAPMFAVVLQAAEKLNRFPVLQKIIKERLN